MPKEFISSDTNVWIDFLTISKLTLPFLLPYTYIMYEESIASELLTPSNFKDDLSAAGLQAVDITIEEYESAEMWENEYQGYLSKIGLLSLLPNIAILFY